MESARRRPRDRWAARRGVAGGRHRPAADRRRSAPDARARRADRRCPGSPPLTGGDTDVLLAELLTDDPGRRLRRPPRVRLLVQLARRGPGPGQRVQPARPHRRGAAGDPAQSRPWPSWACRCVRRSPRLHQGLVLVTGPTGSGKSTTLAVDDRPDQPRAGLPHHHHRGPDRVPAPAQARDRQPARGRHRHRVVPRRAALRPAQRPGRAAGRRDARPRVDPVPR